MRKIFVGFFATLGVLLTIVMISVLFMAKHLVSPEFMHPLPKKFVLVVDMGQQSTLEYEPAGSLLASLITRNELTFYELHQVLSQAKGDPRISSILLKTDGCSLSISQIQEIRQLLTEFKESGRLVYAYAHSYGDGHNGTKDFYLASVANELYIQPMGILSFTGMMLEVPFAKQLLDDYKIRGRIIKRDEFKSTPETVLEKDFTPAHRENMQDIISTLMDQITDDIAQDFEKTPQEIRKWVDGAPYTPVEAHEHGMVEDLLNYSTLRHNLSRERENDTKLSFVEALEYSEHIIPQPDTESKIALIFAEGIIVPNGQGNDLLSGDMTIEGDTVAKVIQEAAEDKKVRAIVLRLNTGGGSPSASETISHAIEQAQEKGVFVVVSMSSATASGGYWIANRADKIVALPATLTGSIGVYGGKIVTEDAWNHFGVHWGEVHSGKNSGMWSSSKDFTDQGWERMQNLMDYVYDNFIQHVAEGRGLSEKDVHEIAKGRVWTGSQAKDIGLVDELGGLDTAIILAKQLANLEEKETKIEVFPKAKSFFEKFSKTTSRKAAVSFLEAIGVPVNLLNQAHRYPLQMPEMTIR